MNRTSFHAGTVQDSNVAKAYGTFDDGNAAEILSVKVNDEHFGGANGGIRTCIKDLLSLYASLLDAAKHKLGITEEEPQTPFKQAG